MEVECCKRMLVCFLLLAVTEAATDWDVRLNGTNSDRYNGRVEVWKGSWGTICDDDFDDSDAKVICKQLQLSGGKAVYNLGNTYGVGAAEMPIHIYSLNCNGNEDNLAQCIMDTNGQCSHSEDVGVECAITMSAVVVTAETNQQEVHVVHQGVCSPGVPSNVRLKGPQSKPSWGFVEVFHPTRGWGSVCDDHFDSNDANVICNSLCYNNPRPLVGISQKYNYIKEHVITNILLDDLQCTGTETDIFNCTHRGIGVHNCRNGTNGEYASVQCSEETSSHSVQHIDPTLDCSNELFNIQFDVTLDKNLQQNHLTIYGTPLSSGCAPSFSRNESFLSMKIKQHECNARINTNATHISHSVMVFYNYSERSGVVTRKSDILYEFICDAPRNASDNNNYRPESKNKTLRGQTQFEVEMILYENNEFAQVISQNSKVEMNTILAVSVDLLSSNPNLWLVLLKCFATPRSNRDDIVNHLLIDNKCPSDDTVRIHPRAPKSVGFDFVTFRFYEYSMVYLHCEGIVCENNEKTASCDQTCVPGNRKKRRTKREADSIVFISASIFLRESNHGGFERLESGAHDNATTPKVPTTPRKVSAIINEQEKIIINFVKGGVNRPTFSLIVVIATLVLVTVFY